MGFRVVIDKTQNFINVLNPSSRTEKRTSKLKSHGYQPKLGGLSGPETKRHK